MNVRIVMTLKVHLLVFTLHFIGTSRAFVRAVEGSGGELDVSSGFTSQLHFSQSCPGVPDPAALCVRSRLRKNMWY
jgi:hypothetical protein